MNANAILIAYMIDNDMRDDAHDRRKKLVQAQTYKLDLYFSASIAAMLCISLSFLN